MISDLIELNNNLRAVKKLNTMLELDPEFTTKIMGTRFPVNDKYADSDFVCTEMDGRTEAGTLGVLNGLIENNEKYRICATYDNDVLLRFELLELVDGVFKVKG